MVELILRNAYAICHIYYLIRYIALDKDISVSNCRANSIKRNVQSVISRHS